MEHLTINHSTITILPTEQFKTISIFIVFIGTFDRKSATSRLLLNRLLSSSTEQYNTKKKFNDKLLGLYDAYFNIASFAMYQTMFTIFELEIIDPNLIGDPLILEEGVAFLKQVIMHPLLDHQAFPMKEFMEEKRIIRDRILNIYNNKVVYSTIRLLELIAKDDVMTISPSGNLEVLETMTPEGLYQDYQTLLQEDARVVVVGHVEANAIHSLMADLKLSFLDQPHRYYGRPSRAMTDPAHVVEEQAIQQSRLLMGYDTDVFYHSLDLYAMIVFNTMLGGMATSSLFTIIREQYSLAYQIDSSLSFEFGLLVINGGIDASQEETVIGHVKDIIKAYQQGSIDPVLLKMAQDNISSNLKESLDRPSELFQTLLRHELLHQPLIPEFIDIIQAVTLDDIKRVSQQLSLHTIYFLKGMGPDYAKK